MCRGDAGAYEYPTKMFYNEVLNWIGLAGENPHACLVSRNQTLPLLHFDFASVDVHGHIAGFPVHGSRDMYPLIGLELNFR